MKAIIHHWPSCLISLLCALTFASCRSTNVNLSVFVRTPDHPQGVDSLTIVRSDSIIKFLFVDYQSSQKAERLLNRSLEALERADSLYYRFKKMQPDTIAHNADAAPDSSSNDMKEAMNMLKQIRNELQFAESNLLQSTRLNPFLLASKEALAQTYILWADVEKSNLYLEKAIAIFEEILKLEKGEHNIFAKLAECYFRLMNWQKALNNYVMAERILLATNFVIDSVLHELPETDSLKNELHFDYLYSQAVCLARMYKATEALAMLKRAKEKAVSENKKKLAEAYEDWLTWDNGNIRAAEEKNNILELIQKKKYEDAVVRFEKLKNELKDPTAIDEIEWRIAHLEFKFLDRKQEACERMLRVVKNYRLLTAHPDVQTAYSSYIEDCGVMHYHLGMEFIQSSDYKQAQKYLEQGARLEWSGNYKCDLELAKLNRHDPKLTLEIVDRVLQQPLRLSRDEMLTALEIKLSALRKMGPGHLAEASIIYRQIRELQNQQ